jgi:polygalacturonase
MYGLSVYSGYAYAQVPNETYTPPKSRWVIIDDSQEASWVAINTATYNVKNPPYNAKGDGLTDDTAAIQAAINAVPAGGTVYIPDGTYMIEAVNAHLNLKSNMTLSLASAAILKALPWAGPGSGVVRVYNLTDVSIIGGIIDGNKDHHTPPIPCDWRVCGQWGMGIDVYDSTNLYIEGVIAMNCFGDGFYFGGSANANPVSKNIRVYKVTADLNRRQGLTITSVDGMTIDHSLFKNTDGTNPMAGIDMEPDPGNVVKNVSVTNSVFINNSGAGLMLWAGPDNQVVNNITVTGNTMSNNTPNYGIWMLNVQDTVVHNNVMQGNLSAIRLEAGTTRVTITNNIVSPNDSSPYITDLGYGNVITNNNVTTNVIVPIPDPLRG